MANIDRNISIKNQLEQLEDIATHKTFVMQACHKMAKYFIKQGKTHLALALMKRGFDHDYSKLQEDEFFGMAKYSDDNAGLKDPNKTACEGKMEAIQLHQSRNTHHPEYWEERIIHIPELDLIEMCCDWCSRSLQYGTNLVEFLKVRQENRFNFPQEIYEKCLYYCNVLSQEESDWKFEKGE